MEPVLRNPNPSAGLAGCRAVAQFWAGLTKVDSPADRRAKLESFYFDGLPGMPPVIDPDNFTAASGGGIRTTQQGADRHPRMYQFRLTKDCSTACTLRMTPDVLQNMPIGRFFDSASTMPGAQAFQDAFVEQVPNLAVRDVNEYFMEIPRAFLMAESNPFDNEPAFILQTSIRPKQSRKPRFPQPYPGKADGDRQHADAGTDRRSRRSTELRRLPHRPPEPWAKASSSLTRSTTSNRSPRLLRKPARLGQRYRISAAVRDVFIPHRMKILIDFLNSGKAPVRSQ